MVRLRLIISLWWTAARGYSFPASVVPVFVGSTYAHYATGAFDLAHLLLALLGGVLYHAGCNLLNDYFDFAYGIDREGSFDGSGVLPRRLLLPETVLTAAIICFAVGSLIGLYFIRLYGYVIALIGLVGLLGAVFYTAGKKNAKYNALGEPLVFVMMGVLMVVGSYLTQTGTVTLSSVLVSLPVAFLVTAILQGNDIRDAHHDAACGIRTLAILLGPHAARLLLSLLLAAAYLSLVALVAFRVVPLYALLALLTTGLAWRSHAVFFGAATGKGLTGQVEALARLHLFFGMLFVIGVVIGS